MSQSDDARRPKCVILSDPERWELVNLCLSGMLVTEARREFIRRHPKSSHPGDHAVRRLIQRYSETGSVASRKAPGRNPNVELKTAILKMARENPHLTNSELAAHFGITFASVRAILTRGGFKRDKLVVYQRTTDEEFSRRVAYCTWFSERITQLPTLSDDILFSDEAVFHLHGEVNPHKIVYYSSSKVEDGLAARHQYNLKLLVWCAIHNRTVLGPYFFPANLNATSYLQCLSLVLKPYLDSLPPSVRNRMYFQHDSALPHRAKTVCQWLDKQFADRWIGWDSKVSWPPRAFELTPVNFFLWEHLQSVVFTPTPTTLKELRENICDACRNITSEQLASASSDILRRVSKCLEESNKRKVPGTSVSGSEHLNTPSGQ